MALDHLRLRIELLVAAIQGFEHHRGVVTSAVVQTGSRLVSFA
jgi:hypothetical protein